MPRPRIVMRKIREVLRLRLGERMTLRTVAAVTGLPYTTVSDHIARAVRCGLGWPLPGGMDDIELEKQLFAREPSPPKEMRPVPDWGWVRKQLSRVGVTLMLLWVEFKELHPDTYGYTQFVRYYRQWEQRCDLVMRQEHRAGQKLFVDVAGKKAINDEHSHRLVRSRHRWPTRLYVSNRSQGKGRLDHILKEFLGGLLHEYSRAA